MGPQCQAEARVHEGRPGMRGRPRPRASPRHGRPPPPAPITKRPPPHSGNTPRGARAQRTHRSDRPGHRERKQNGREQPHAPQCGANCVVGDSRETSKAARSPDKVSNQPGATLVYPFAARARVLGTIPRRSPFLASVQGLWGRMVPARGRGAGAEGALAARRRRSPARLTAQVNRDARLVGRYGSGDGPLRGGGAVAERAGAGAGGAVQGPRAHAHRRAGAPAEALVRPLPPPGRSPGRHAP